MIMIMIMIIMIVMIFVVKFIVILMILLDGLLTEKPTPADTWGNHSTNAAVADGCSTDVNELLRSTMSMEGTHEWLCQR